MRSGRQTQAAEGQRRGWTTDKWRNKYVAVIAVSFAVAVVGVPFRAVVLPISGEVDIPHNSLLRHCKPFFGTNYLELVQDFFFAVV